MNFCCEGFRNAIDQRHDRGLFIYVLPPGHGDPQRPSFRIASRSVLPDDLQRFQQSGAVMPIDVTLSCQTGLRYCPWCGVRLAEFYCDGYPELIDEQIISEFKIA
jgi:hypothetical protein